MICTLSTVQAQKWSMSIEAGAMYHHSTSDALPIEDNIFLSRKAGPQIGFRVYRQVHHSISTYLGLNVGNADVGVNIDKLFQSSEPVFFKGADGFDYFYAQLEGGFRYVHPVSNNLYIRVLAGVSIVNWDGFPETVDFVLENTEQEITVSIDSRSNRIAEYTALMKTGIGLEYRFSRKNKLALELIFAKGFESTYFVDFTEFNYNGTNHEVNMLTDGTHAGLQLTYEFALSRRKFW